MIQRIDDFINRLDTFAKIIQNRRSEIMKLLIQYETLATVNDEIERSIDTLVNATDEFKYLPYPPSNLTMSTFFPLNLPLYSLILFAIMPCFFSKRIFLRSPEVMQPIITPLTKLLLIPQTFPEILIRQCDRSTFTSIYCKDSDVILFTGKYENAYDIQQKCPNSLHIFNGGGINPFVLFDDANIELAAQKAVEMRTFNSGQDCAGPDAFFIPESLQNTFYNKVIHHLNDLKIGGYNDITTDIGPILKRAYIDDLEHVLNINRKNIKFGGKIDRRRNIIYPTVIVKPLCEHQGGFHEFFGPIFYIVTYKSTGELRKMFTTNSHFRDYSMYISYFGNDKLIEDYRIAIPLRNTIVNDIERGINAYGGYGIKSNFVAFGEKVDVRPMLISKEVQTAFKTHTVATNLKLSSISYS